MNIFSGLFGVKYAGMISNLFKWLFGLIDAIMRKLYPGQPLQPTATPLPPPVEATGTPPQAPTSSVATSVDIIQPPPYLLWETPKQAFHSTRVVCDEMGLDYDQKNEICFTIYGESEFHAKAIGKPNKNGTKDYGLCQYNDGKNAKGIPFWIGKGATFASIDEVLNNPEKCVRVMIQTYKAGNIGWWYGHRGYTLEKAKTSPMWKLA